MTIIEGELEAGEAQSALAAVAQRQRGSPFIYVVALVFFMTIAAALATAAAWFFTLTRGQFAAIEPWALIVGGWTGWLAYLAFSRTLLVRQFRRRSFERNLALRTRQSIQVDDEGLTLRSGSVRRIASWSAVTDVFKVRGYWVILVQMEPWLIPARFFPAITEERVFIAQILDRVGPDTVKRSQGAVRFAAKQS